MEAQAAGQTPAPGTGSPDAAVPDPNQGKLKLSIRWVSGQAVEPKTVYVAPEESFEPAIWTMLRELKIEVDGFVVYDEGRARRVDPSHTCKDAGLVDGASLRVGQTADVPDPLAPYRQLLVDIRTSKEWPITEERGLELLRRRAELGVTPAEHKSLAVEARVPPDDAVVLLDWKPARERGLEEYGIHLKVVAGGSRVEANQTKKLAELRDKLGIGEAEHHALSKAAGVSEDAAKMLLDGKAPVSGWEAEYKDALTHTVASDYDVESLQVLRELVESRRILRGQHRKMAQEAGVPEDYIDSIYEEPSSVPPGRKFYIKQLLRLSKLPSMGQTEYKVIKALREKYHIMRTEHFKLCRDWEVREDLSEELWELKPVSSKGGLGGLIAVLLFILVGMVIHPATRSAMGDQLMKVFNPHTWSAFDKDGFGPDGYDKDGYDRRGYNRTGFNRLGYDRQGFNRANFNASGYDREGFDREGYNVQGYDRTSFDRFGYDKEGFDRAGLDRHGFKRDGTDRDGFNREGFDPGGYSREGFDAKGFDREGFARDGFNRDGFNREGRDRLGFDRSGRSQDGFDKDGWDPEGYGRDGFNKDGKNRQGQTREQVANPAYDKDGFDKDGYDRDGLDRNGLNRDGFDRQGYDRQGLDKLGYNRSGFDRWGYDKLGFDKTGVDRDGYGRDGFNKDGFNRGGFDRQGFDKDGIDKAGFNRLGFDREGYDKQGFDRTGFNRDGRDPRGFDRDGYTKEGIGRKGEDLLPGALAVVKDQAGNSILKINGEMVPIGKQWGPFGVIIERVGQTVKFRYNGQVYERRVLR